MSLTNEQKLKMLHQEVKELEEALDKKEDELLVVQKAVFEERMIGVPANAMTVLLYHRNHWLRSEEASERYDKFWEGFSHVCTRVVNDQSKLVLLPKQEASESDQCAEISKFLPYLKEESFLFVESCKGDIVDIKGKVIEIRTNMFSFRVNKMSLVIKEDGSGCIISPFNQVSSRFREKTRSENWVDLVHWINKHFGV